jgi:hypothetical protein
VKKVFLRSILTATSALALTATHSNAQLTLIAKGQLTGSRAGEDKDLSGLNYNLENGVPANLLGGLGSGITYVTGNTFLAVPDRGPNAVTYNDAIDQTVSYIPRFQTIEMKLEPNADPKAALPFTLTPQLKATTLLRSFFPLFYGDGQAFNVPNGAPKPNGLFRFFFSGRSDNFDPRRNHNSGDPLDARLDPESIRVSSDGLTVFISDEYGPYIYQFLRLTGERVRTYRLPDELYVDIPGTTTKVETANNTKGRTPNKGMEGLAITPDGRTLVGIMQNALLQDAAAAPSLLRIFTVDVVTGVTKHEYAYLLTAGTGVSEITALNDHEFIVDERDGKGLGDGSKAKVKQLFKIELQNAVDIQGLDGPAASTVAVPKTPFLDIIQKLKDAGFTVDNIPAKIEGVTFGPDVERNGKKLHTLWIANDNDFLQDMNGPNITSPGINPNQFFVFGFTDSDLDGSQYVPQKHPFFFDF